MHFHNHILRLLLFLLFSGSWATLAFPGYSIVLVKQCSRIIHSQAHCKRPKATSHNPAASASSASAEPVCESVSPVVLSADEKEDICLHEQPMKWLLPPGLSTTGGAPDTGRGSGRPRRTAPHSDSVRVKRQPSARRLGQVNITTCWGGGVLQGVVKGVLHD